MANKPGLHPRNRHREGYDFTRLIAARRELAPHVARNAYGTESIDFADPAAVKELNQALLASTYGIRRWELPPGWLCPAVPGRADYVHHLADLLAAGGKPPRGDGVRILDVGVGASAIYPILGRCAYGWSFVGTDVDREALAAAQRTVEANPRLKGGVELRRQRDGAHILSGVLRPGESFAASMCNPPFHASPRAAREATARKWKNLGRSPRPGQDLNFGGQERELWCRGGESAFLRRLIAESALFPASCRWFTSLVSRAALLPELKAALRTAGAEEVRVVEMAQGQKKTRFLAWSFAG